MAALILLILFGLAFSSFATQNTGSVHILIGSYVFNNIPLYAIVIGSILLGVFISWLIHIVEEFSVFFTLQTKDTLLKKSQKTIEELQEKNDELEKEIAMLSTNEDTQEVSEEREVQSNNKHSLLYHLKHGLSLDLH